MSVQTGTRPYATRVGVAQPLVGEYGTRQWRKNYVAHETICVTTQ